MKKIVQIFFAISCLIIAPAITNAQSNKASHQLTSLIPPFVREGDRPIFQFRLSNSSSLDWGGTAHFTLSDSVTNEAVDGWFFNSLGNQYFTIDPLKKDFIGFPLEIPFDFKKKAQWKLCTVATIDTLCSQGSIRILPWQYENEEPTTPLSPELPVVRKKINGKSVDELIVVRKGELIQVEVEIQCSRYKKAFSVTENLPAGILINPTSILVKGSNNQILFSSKNFPTNSLTDAHDFSIKEDFSKTPILKISYQLRATYLGTFHIPPTLLKLTDAQTVITRSAIGLLTIE